jgi:hypothetical protein
MSVTAADFTSRQHIPELELASDEAGQARRAIAEGLNHVAESSGHQCDSAVHRLSGGRAPGLEQNSYFGAANRDSVPGPFGRGCLLGLPDANGLAALKVRPPEWSPHGVSDESDEAVFYSGRFQE